MDWVSDTISIMNVPGYASVGTGGDVLGVYEMSIGVKWPISH